VIIGAAFGGVVGSLTDNILSPIIGLFTGRNFDGLELAFLGVSVKYGAFVTNVINFLILAFVVFLLVKMMNKLTSLTEKTREAAVMAEPTKRACPYCMTEIHAEATRCPACTSELEPPIRQRLT
jgi:large conductance mechanosensitive channel